MTNAELVDALHRAMRELERLGEQSALVDARVKGVKESLEGLIDRILADEMDADLELEYLKALKRIGGTSE